MHISQERLRQTFCELIAINSFYPDDLPVQQYVLSRLRHRNIPCQLDNFGNVIASLPGNNKKPAVMLNTHLDIPEDTPKVFYKETDKSIEGIGDTILGADPKTGLAVLIELALELAVSNPTLHVPVDFVFTRGEEQGLLGAQALDLSKVSARVGLVVDQDGPVTEVVTKAPGSIQFHGVINGKTVHTREPHLGVNALQIVADAITQVPLGHTTIGKQVTWNVGFLRAGTAVNSVPGSVEFKAELRSFDGQLLQTEAKRVYNVFNNVTQSAGGVLAADQKMLYEPYSLGQDDPLLLALSRLYKKLGLEESHLETFGASDANIFNARGIACVAVGSGYYNAHQYFERADLADMQTLAVFLDSFVRA